MTHERLELLFIRLQSSLDYKFNTALNTFDNNWKHNGEDVARLYDREARACLFEARCQTVSNHPDATKYKFGDTLQTGSFGIRCFVAPRAFHGQPHGIIDAFDLEGQPIDDYSMQNDPDFPGYQNGRWLVHDRYSFKTGKDTHYAWSGGCIIFSSADLGFLNAKLRELGVKKDDVIPARLIESKSIPSVEAA